MGFHPSVKVTYEPREKAAPTRFDDAGKAVPPKPKAPPSAPAAKAPPPADQPSAGPAEPDASRAGAPVPKLLPMPKRGRGRPPRAEPKPPANPPVPARGRGRPLYEFYPEEPERWMHNDMLEMLVHMLAGHRNKDCHCRGCVWYRDTQRWKRVGGVTTIYPPWERVFVADFTTGYRPGFDPYQAKVFWFAYALDSGEGFVVGVKDQDTTSCCICLNELEVEASLRAPQTSAEMSHFYRRYVIKHDQDGTFTRSPEVRERAGRFGGRVHYSAAREGVARAEAWVKHARELIGAAMVAAALDERHRLIVAKTVLAQRNFDMGFEHVINIVVPFVLIGALATVVLPMQQRKKLGIAKSAPRALLCCIVGIDWTTTCGVYVEIPIVSRYAKKSGRRLTMMVTCVNFYSCRQYLEMCHGWTREGVYLRRRPHRSTLTEEGEGLEPNAPARAHDVEEYIDSDDEGAPFREEPYGYHFLDWTADAEREYVLPTEEERETFKLNSVRARDPNDVVWCRQPLYGPCESEDPTKVVAPAAPHRCAFHREYDRIVNRATLPPGPLPAEARPQRDEDPPLPGRPPPGDPRNPEEPLPDASRAGAAPPAAEGPDPRDVARRVVDRMKDEYNRVLRDFTGNPGGRISVNPKTGSSRPVSAMTADAERSLEKVIISAVLSVAEEDLVCAAREGRIRPDEDEPNAEPPPQHERAPFYVTKNIGKGQSQKPPFNDYDWFSAFMEECTKVFGEFKVLCKPCASWEVPKTATRAALIAVRAIKYYDLARALHQARVRVVYGGHRIWDAEGNTIDKRDHPRVDVARLGATSPFEVRVSLAWAMIAPSEGLDLAVPIVVSFDVTSAYLQASLNDQEYYVCIEDEMLLDALKEVTGWKWDFPGKAWFRMNKALYGHPLAGDFWAGTFKVMVVDIGFSAIESDDEKTVYVYYKNDRIVAVLVIYVDDGFLVTFDKEVADKTEKLLREQWQVREWNVWTQEKSQRFLASDHTLLANCSKVVPNLSKVIIDMSSYKRLGVKSYIEDGGVLASTTPKTPMTTEEESDGQAWRTASGPSASRVDPDADLNDREEVFLLAIMAELSADQRESLRQSSSAVRAAERAASTSASRVGEVGADKAARHVGIWSYPSMNAVPEISFAVQWLARRVTKWNDECERRLKRLVTYVSGRADDCLLLVGVRGDDIKLIVEEDADFAGDKSRRSTTGFVVKLVGPMGTHVLLDWKSQLQKNISLSTAEAGIVAFRDALRRVVGMLDYLETFFGRIPVEIRCDSSACLGIVAKGYSKALKHVRKLQDVSTKWVKETIDQLDIKAVKVSSEDNGSDCMTKALSVDDTVHHFRFGLGIVDVKLARGDFHRRQCNGAQCRRLVGEPLAEGEVCYCNGGRPRDRSFHKDYIYSAVSGILFKEKQGVHIDYVEIARSMNFDF